MFYARFRQTKRARDRSGKKRDHDEKKFFKLVFKKINHIYLVFKNSFYYQA